VPGIAPQHLRDSGRAPALAERAARLDPHNPLIRNTLGVTYDRAGRYREAAAILGGNLPGQNEKYLASDLYFLAMSHHRLGEVALAQAYYNWANRVTGSQADLTVEEVKNGPHSARKPCARRSDRPKHLCAPRSDRPKRATVALRASVGWTEASGR
jgi:hypothetical protein